MKKHLLLLVMMLLLKAASADAVEIDGIWYNLVSNEKLAEVAKNPSGSYSGAIVIPEKFTYHGKEYSVTSIGEGAFYYCTGLTSVTIPGSMTSIGNYAFNSCTGLTSVTIPNSVTSIGKEAFAGCSGLTSINVEDGNTKYDSRDNCNAIIETSSNTLIAGCKNSTIPGSVTSIGKYAFYYCTVLTSVTIPGSVTSIGSEAFLSCSGLTSVTIGNSVTSIGEKAFSECSGLTSVTIGNSVTRIGNDAFYKCHGLTSITIPNSVTSIGMGAFGSCSGLTSITIPNSVTSIGDYAFAGCSGLTSVTIGNSVTSIGSNAFYKCSGLADVTCMAERVPSTISDTFADSKTNYATLHVPGTAINSYKSTKPWSKFKEVVALTDQQLSIDGITKDNITEAARYAIDGQCANQNTKGLNIIRMPDGTVRKVMVK